MILFLGPDELSHEDAAEFDVVILANDFAKLMRFALNGFAKAFALDD